MGDQVSVSKEKQGASEKVYLLLWHDEEFADENYFFLRNSIFCLIFRLVGLL